MLNKKLIDEFCDSLKEQKIAKNLSEVTLKEILQNRRDARRIIKTIKSFSVEQQQKLLDVVENIHKYKFSIDNANQVFYDEINILKNNMQNYVDLAKLYYALQPNEILYKRVLDDYLDKNYRKRDYNLTDYIMPLEEYCDQFHGLIDPMVSTTKLDQALMTFTPSQLTIFLKNHGNDTFVKTVMDYFVKNENIEMKSNLKSMSDSNFTILLDQIFTFEKLPSKEVINAKLHFYEKMIESSSNQEKLAKKLSNMKYLLEPFLMALDDINNEENSYNYIFKVLEEDVSDDFSIFFCLKQLPESYYPVVSKLFNDSYIFCITSKMFRASIFWDLIDFSDIEGRKIQQFERSIKFLFDEEPIPFVEKLNESEDISIFSKVLSFLRASDSMEILEAKIFAINCIKNQLPDLSDKDFLEYVSFLNIYLKSKSDKEQAKVIKARSKYFKNHKVTKFHLNELSKNLSNAIINCDSSKRMKQLCRFSKIEKNYNQKIADSIVEYLAHSQSMEQVKKLVNLVKTPEFLRLDNVDKEKKLADFSIVNGQCDLPQGTSIIIPDSNTISDVTKNKDHILEFVNKETGLKIYAKKQMNNRH